MMKIRAPYEFSSIEDDQNLYLCSWNVHVTSSYVDKLQLLDELSSRFYVVELYETFLFVNQSLSLCSFPGYNLHVKNLTSLGGCGIALLAKEGIRSGTRDDHST